MCEVYEPREDSELLLEAALEEVRESDVVLEVGVGSGYVLEGVREKCKLAVGTDISPCAVKVARERGLNVIRTDLVRGLRRVFTLILFNPPYLELEEHERTGDWIDVAIDGGRHGIEVMVRFLDMVRDVMVGNGRILMVVSSVNVPYIFDEIRKRGFEYEIVKSRRLFFEELYVLRITSSRDL